jgi:branched-chain amino acid transport system ATP-binding protein
VLEVDNLAVGYAGADVLHDVSLRVGTGEVVALVGSNGAGKTTFLNTIAGLHRGGRGSRVRGQVRLSGRPVTTVSAPWLVRHGLALVPERRQIWPEHTVADNLLLGAFSRRRDKGYVQQRTTYCYELFPRLGERRAQHAGTLSGGEQQMLAIARALMSSPQLLLLDEPSMGLAPLVVRRIFEVIRELKRDGLTVLLVEQMVTMALETADRGYVLERGRTILDGPARTLLADPAVRAAYLGVAVDTSGVEAAAAAAP